MLSYLDVLRWSGMICLGWGNIGSRFDSLGPNLSWNMVSKYPDVHSATKPYSFATLCCI
ncbi:MAG: hypothetical protein QW371_04660 [Candidatus Bathyarchaeia archaeon]